MKIFKCLADLMSECSECGKENLYLLQIGETPDYDSNTALLCFDCINKAMNVVKQQIPKSSRRLPDG